MRRILADISFFVITAVFLSGVSFAVFAQSVKEMEKEKQQADKEIKETKAELTANEKKVNQSLVDLRKIEEDIAVSQKEIETVKGQIDVINGNISSLEKSIAAEEADLKFLREEYLKAVKKMRVARKQNSAMAFLFSAGSFNEARRRMRYMKEFSEWKDRRSSEIKGKVATLQTQRGQLAQARSDASVALGREQAAQSKLSEQRSLQQATVTELRANSDALRSKLAKRQAEARKLSNQISQLIAEEQAKEAEKRRKAEEEKRKAEEKRLAEERAAAEKKAAEERAAQEKAAREKALAEEKTKETPKKEEPKKESPKKEVPIVEEPSQGTEYADARKRKRTPETTKPAPTAETKAAPSASGFEGSKGNLPRPVSGSFKIVSPFGVHPISPELPDIMDENLGIDAHVANGANATAVFEGEVIKVYDRTNTPGFRNIVVVKHGDYITVYANLETLSVHSGDKVKQGQTLGTVGADFDDPSSGLIHFEVWKNQTHLDPAAWIR